MKSFAHMTTQRSQDSYWLILTASCVHSTETISASLHPPEHVVSQMRSDLDQHELKSGRRRMPRPHFYQVVAPVLVADLDNLSVLLWIIAHPEHTLDFIKVVYRAGIVYCASVGLLVLDNNLVQSLEL